MALSQREVECPIIKAPDHPLQRTRRKRRAAEGSRWPIERITAESMNPKVVIRCETAADVDAIRDVTVSAFKTLEISSHTEQFIIAALRAAKSLTVSLVAE